MCESAGELWLLDVQWREFGLANVSASGSGWLVSWVMARAHWDCVSVLLVVI